MLEEDLNNHILQKYNFDLKLHKKMTTIKMDEIAYNKLVFKNYK